MTIMDKELVFEHALRERVNAVKTRLEDMAMHTEGRSMATVYIHYDGMDGGKWTIRYYVNGGDITAKAAELSAAETQFVAIYNMQMQSRNLRALLEASTEEKSY